LNWMKCTDPWFQEYQKFSTPPDSAEGMLDASKHLIHDGNSICIYVLPVGTVTCEIQLPRQTNGQVTSVVAICLMVALDKCQSIHNRRWGGWKLTRANHVGTDARDFLGLVVELVENFIIFGAAISRVKWGNVSPFLLLEPGIGVSDVTN
jgi:hypothetical protein